MRRSERTKAIVDLEHARTVTSADGTTIGYTSFGAGPGVIIVGGALSTGASYARLGQALAGSFTVHLMDRRGRAASGPQGPEYSIERECEDLLAIASATGASRVFGHSYGGLIALQTALRSEVFERIAVYDPGVSVDGSIPSEWIPRYARMLGGGNDRGAFACFVQALGPDPIRRMPLWYVRLVLRAVVRSDRWRHIEPLLQASLAEHKEIVRLQGSVSRYGAIRVPVLLLGGARSPRSGSGALTPLHIEIASSSLDVLEGLDHFAPDEKAPGTVAEHVGSFFGDDRPRSRPV
jgi:pimeloyl-ACP methyl ester carboxylesterase